jgi:hypothetical protein
MDGPTLGLPLGINKSSQSATADVIMAYCRASGLELGLWAHQLQAFSLPINCPWLPLSLPMPTDSLGLPIYIGTLTSILFLLFSLGDPYLSKYDESPDQELVKAFWSFNTMKRTARSVVAKKRPETLPPRTPIEVVEHGRWHLSHSSLDIPMAYLEM